MNKGKLNQLRTAFKRVFENEDVPNDDVLIETITEVLFSGEQLPYESNRLQKLRYREIKDIDDTDAIQKYLVSVGDKFKFNQTSTYAKVFELCKEYNLITGLAPVTKEVKEVSNSDLADSNTDVVEASTVIDEVVSTTVVEEDTYVKQEAEDTKESTQSGEKEILKMENTPIEALAKQAANHGINAEVNVAGGISIEDTQAAQEIIKETQASRLEFSKKAKITAVAKTSIDRAKRAIKGRESMGTVSDPEKQLGLFISKFGVTTHEDGTITFSKLHSTSTSEDARAIYDVLVAAKANPEMLVQPYFKPETEETPVTFKGVVLVDPAGKTTTIKYKELARTLLDKTIGILEVDGASRSQLVLQQIIRGKNKGNVTYSPVVKIANKSELLEDKQILKDARYIGTEPAASKAGYKSALVAYYNRNNPSNTNEPKKQAYRIPLNVEQYTVLTVKDFEDLFSAGIGQALAPVSLDDVSNVQELSTRIAAIMAREVNKEGSTNVSADIKAAIKVQRDEIAKEASEANAASVNASDLENI